MDVVSTGVVRPVSVDILPAGLSAKLGSPRFAPIHVAEKLSPEVLGHDPVEIEHQDRAILGQIELLRVDHEFRFAAKERIGDRADIGQILWTGKAIDPRPLLQRAAAAQ